VSGNVKFFDNFIQEALANLHTCMPARIESFDPVTMKADVQPLFKRKFRGQDAVPLPKQVSVPVACMRAGGFIIRPPYKKGDMALLVFSERALDNVLGTGQMADPESNRKHALDDAIIIGGFLPFINTLSGSNAEDLVIGKEDFTTRVVLKPDDTAEIIAPKGLNITADDPTGTGVQITGRDRSESW